MTDQSILPANCIICGASKWQSKFEVLQQCSQCNFVRADLQIDDATLQQLYSESYFRGDEYADYLADQAVHQKNFRYRLRQLLQLHGDIKSIFEVGCAYGCFLEVCRQRGIAATGIDICEQPVAHARNSGLDAHCGDFLRHEIENNRYGVFCMWDVIEHLPHPDHFAARIHELLPENGLIALTTGDIGARNAVRRGKKWRMIHPPTHLHYFDRKSITALLEQAGFKETSIESVSMYRNVHSVLSALSVFNKGWLGTFAGWCHRLTPKFLQKACGGWVDMGDIMFVTARKSHDA